MTVARADRLDFVHPVLVRVVYHLGQVFPVQVIEGARKPERQRLLYNSGASQTLESYHLIQETGYAHAVDLAPLIDGPLDWSDLHEFWMMGGAVQAIAKEWKIPLIWGRNWDGDNSYKDQSFNDFPHIQIARDFVMPQSGFNQGGIYV